jgi:3-oxoadipate enol-lactonase
MPKAIINSTGIFYQVDGQGDALVMIQGFGGGLNAWSRQIRAFSKHFRVVTFDARGLGKSDISKGPYNIPVMATDVIGLMDHLEINRAHILGLSLGGLVAQTIAINNAARVSKLILASTFPGTDSLHMAMDNIGTSSNSDQADFDFACAMRDLVSMAFNKRIYRHPAQLTLRFMRTAKYTDYIKQMLPMASYSTLDSLHMIQAPTLIITGSGDRIVPPHNSDLLASRIPDAHLAKVEGGSHAFFFEMATTFNKEILNFLL